MTNEVPYSREQITCFVDLLKNELPEHRDNQGNRPPLAFVIVAFVLALLGRAPKAFQYSSFYVQSCGLGIRFTARYS